MMEEEVITVIEITEHLQPLLKKEDFRIKIRELETQFIIEELEKIQKKVVGEFQN